VELEEKLEAIRGRGLAVAAVSYDSPAILKEFAERRGIHFPLLSDPGSAVITRFGLLNPEYPPGDRAHGVPYPGTFVTDADGVIRARYFEKTYVERRTAASFLTATGETPKEHAEDIRTRAFVLRTSASNLAAAPGQRFTLVLDFEMEPTMHAYAPGVTGYRALELRLDPLPLVTFHETVFPPSKPYFFAPLSETVPVFEGRFRVTRDMTLAGGRDPAVAEALKIPDPKMELSGTLEYQACSDRICYPPASQPLRWTVKLLPLDRERSPEEIRHQP
jgi:AhpC/TSA family/Thiol:disulfide interchange protein DsbD, N-terminal